MLIENKAPKVIFGDADDSLFIEVSPDIHSVVQVQTVTGSYRLVVRVLKISRFYPEQIEGTLDVQVPLNSLRFYDPSYGMTTWVDIDSVPEWSSSLSVSINWGDGIDAGYSCPKPGDPPVTHTYDAPGTYEVGVNINLPPQFGMAFYPPGSISNYQIRTVEVKPVSDLPTS
jgi:hypothetical protein